MAIVIPLAETAKRPRRYWLSRGYFAAHQGLDMVGDEMQPILAAESGRVFASSWNGDNWAIGGGNTVILDHFGEGGRRAKTSYAHLKARAVSKGQHVLRGQVIGWSDSTGNSTGHHLHFSLAELVGTNPNDYWQWKWIDPRRYMRQHYYENGFQRDGDLVRSVHLRNSIVVKPSVNLRRSATTGSAVARTTTGPELVCYLDTVKGQVQWGSPYWDKVWHPKAGICYIHTNLGEWVI